MYGLYYDKQFVGTALAIAPRIAVSAGHHLRVTKDMVDNLALRSGSNARGALIEVDFVSKDNKRDVLVIWTSRDMAAHTPLYGFLPRVGANLATTYVALTPPHAKITVSPGELVENENPFLCRLKGTVTQQGASGGPVIDHHGDRVVGMHISTFVDDSGEERYSEFISSRAIISVFKSLSVDPHEPYPEPSAEEPKPPPKENKKKNAGKKRPRSG